MGLSDHNQPRMLENYSYELLFALQYVHILIGHQETRIPPKTRKTNPNSGPASAGQAQ